jgi:hypothetical protein
LWGFHARSVQSRRRRFKRPLDATLSAILAVSMQLKKGHRLGNDWW